MNNSNVSNGKLYVVGIGSGNYDDLTVKSTKILNESEYIFCDEKTFEKVKNYVDVKKIKSNTYTSTRERYINAINKTLENKVVCILSSGDSGIYGISSLIFEYIDNLNESPDVIIVPGITSAISGAALLGAPLMQDFVVITLSDNFVNSTQLKSKIVSVAKENFSIVFYSPSNPTHTNLVIALEILRKHRSKNTIVGLVKNIGDVEEKIIITDLNSININDVNSKTIIFIGNNQTTITKSKKMITPLL